MTKQAFAVWSTQPGANGFCFEDVSEAVSAEFTACEVVANYRGEGRILGYTVLYQANQPQRAVAVLELPRGEHTVAWNEDPAVMQAMEKTEYCGCRVEVSDNQFSMGVKDP
jgi:uncharacterized OB-fold protein